MPPRSRDPNLVDILNARDVVRHTGVVYRVVKHGRDPILPGRSGGRWDDGTFDVLYTSLEAAGAKAEMAFHLSKGQPVIPSKPVYHLYRLSVEVEDVLDIARPEDMTALGIDTRTYGRLCYAERKGEYPRCQDVGEIANFLGLGGLRVPSARHRCANFVILYQSSQSPKVEILEDMGPVNFKTTGHP